MSVFPFQSRVFSNNAFFTATHSSKPHFLLFRIADQRLCPCVILCYGFSDSVQIWAAVF